MKMKLVFTILLLTWVMFTGCINRNSQESQLVYNCQETATPPTVDGRLNDKQWQAADILPIKYHRPGTSNASVAVKMLWDDNYVYIGAEIKDHNLIASHTERDSKVWQDDCIEFYLDTEAGSHHQLTYFEIDITPGNTIFDTFFVNYHSYPELYHKGACEMVNSLNLEINSSIRLNGTINNSSDIDSGWNLEIALPIKQLQTKGAKRKIHAGTQWRANFYYHNVEDNREFMSWSPIGADNSAHRPGLFGKIYFSEKQQNINSQKLNTNNKIN